MGRSITTTPPDGASDVGTMVIMVLLAAFVPAGCVLWFLDAAMENQQLAVKQQLTDVYRGQFDARKDGLNAFWKGVDQKLTEARKLDDVQGAYQLLITGEVCSAVVVYDASGRVLCPRQLAPTQIEETNIDLWDKARDLESGRKNDEAAGAYAEIAAKSDTPLAARAMRAEIRCLVRGDRTGEAINVIVG